jgi:hypothetical protein
MKGKEAEIQAGTLVTAIISESRQVKINPELKSNPNKVLNSSIRSSQIKSDCGDKPIKPTKFIDPHDRKRKNKQYEKKLKIWNDCTTSN